METRRGSPWAICPLQGGKKRHLMRQIPGRDLPGCEGPSTMKLAGRPQKAFERDYPTLLEKPNQPDQDLGCRAGIAQSGMPARHGDSQAACHGLQGVIGE